MTRRLVYLASPYSHPSPEVRHQRFEAACNHAARMMRDGLFVFSPIAHTHPIALHGGLPLGFDYWREYDERMLSACDELQVLMLAGWKESVGVNAEIAMATARGMAITYVEA